MSFNLSNRTYKELQEMAKSCSIPANIKRDLLVKAIKAYYEKDEKILQSVLNEVKTARVKRKKPKTTNSRPNRRSKDKNCMGDGSDDNVDSTSGSTKELVPCNRYVDPNQGSSLSVDQSNLIDRLYSRQHSTYLDGVGQYSSGLEYCVGGALSSNQLQSNYMSSSSAVMPYNGLLQKDARQNYGEYNSNYPSYHASSYYRQSCPSFSWMETPASYFAMHHDTFYASQLPASKLFDPKIVSSDVTNYPREQSKSYLTSSKSGYYGVETNGTTVEMDCSTNLLPTVPQAEVDVENHENISSAWSQNVVTPTYPDRIQFSPGPTYSYQQNGRADDTFNFPAADNESISAEVDSASDADNRSLADDIADLLSMDNVEQDPAALNLRQLMSELPQQGQSTSVLSNEQAYYANSSCGYYASTNSSTKDALKTVTWPLSTQNVEKADTTIALPGSQSTQPQNDGFQLPAFSTFMHDSKSLTDDQNGLYSDYQSTSQEPRDLSYPNCSQQSTNSTTSSCLGCTQQSGCAQNENTSSSSNDPVGRHQQIDLDISYQDDPLQNDCFIVEPDASPTPQSMSKAAPDSTFILSSYSTQAIANTNGYADTSTYGENSEVLEIQPNIVGTSSSMPKNDACGQTSEAAGLIYEKETLHRSKIICESSAKNGIKENVVHEFVKIFIPSDGKNTVFNQSTKRKKISDKLDKLPSSTHSVMRNSGLPLTRACWYKSIGCTFEAKPDIVTTHEKKCKFQTIYCPSESCSWRESFNMLIRHITDFHGKELRERQQFLYTIDRITTKHDRPFYTFYQTYNDIIYVIRLHIDEEKCVAAVQYIPDIQGSCIKMRNLRAIMEFVSFPDKRRVKTWKGFIQPYSDTVDKCQYNTMRIDVEGSEFIALYVCIC